jgi:hypothetical protein
MPEELTRAQERYVGARLREEGVRIVDVANALDRSQGWVSDNCSGVDPETL